MQISLILLFQYNSKALFLQLYHLTVKSFIGTKEIKNKTYSDFQELHSALLNDRVVVILIPKFGRRINLILHSLVAGPITPTKKFSGERQETTLECHFEVLVDFEFLSRNPFNLTVGCCSGLEAMLNQMMLNPDIAVNLRL